MRNKKYKELREKRDKINKRFERENNLNIKSYVKELKQICEREGPEAAANHHKLRLEERGSKAFEVLSKSKNNAKKKRKRTRNGRNGNEINERNQRNQKNQKNQKNQRNERNQRNMRNNRNLEIGRNEKNRNNQRKQRNQRNQRNESNERNERDQEKWKCTNCTMMNNPHLMICEVCDTAKPVETESDNQNDDDVLIGMPTHGGLAMTRIEEIKLSPNNGIMEPPNKKRKFSSRPNVQKTKNSINNLANNSRNNIIVNNEEDESDSDSDIEILNKNLKQQRINLKPTKIKQEKKNHNNKSGVSLRMDDMDDIDDIDYIDAEYFKPTRKDNRELSQFVFGLRKFKMSDNGKRANHNKNQRRRQYR